MSRIVRAPLFGPGAVFVAGGSGGIGTAICKAIAEAGSNVVLSYRSNRASADETAQAVREYGVEADIVQLDLADSEAVKSAVDEVAAKQPLHTVIYAAGPFVELKFLSSVSPEEFKQYLLGDTCACFNLVHASLPHLRKSRGSIVAITTTVLARWAPQDGLSAIPKAGVDRLISGVAREEGRFGVRANSVALGVIEAGQFHKNPGIDDKYLQALAANVPLRRLGKAEEVADAVVFLASSRAGYTTGQRLHVDGGYPI